MRERWRPGGLNRSLRADPDAAVERYVGSAVGDHLETVDEMSGGEGITGRGDSVRLYVDGTSVRLDVAANSFHGDHWWSATYHVDDHVVRRSTGADADPDEGKLLECRTDA